jgi:hypothetical protein
VKSRIVPRYEGWNYEDTVRYLVDLVRCEDALVNSIANEYIYMMGCSCPMSFFP